MPKVAIICLCYNQAQYVNAALESVLKQTYTNWELIVVDDGSTDNSIWEIEQFKLAHPDINMRTIFLAENIGNCRAFNKALMLSSAKYIIDLAADDLLLPERLEQGVKNLEAHDDVALNFTNASFIDANNQFLKNHFEVGPLGKAEQYIPEGHIFEALLKKYIICPPTAMIRASSLKAIGGYDETLAYEDFDLFLRLSFKHKFSYTDKILVKKRDIQNSWSKLQYKKGNGQLESTLKICRKIFNLINTPSQKNALILRVAYEAKQSFIHLRIKLFVQFMLLGVKTLFVK